MQCQVHAAADPVHSAYVNYDKITCVWILGMQCNIYPAADPVRSVQLVAASETQSRCSHHTLTKDHMHQYT